MIYHFLEDRLKPNILFLVIDSLREDKLSGSKSSTTNLDRLMESGIYFSQAISSSDATLLSEVSIFTGLYPFKTGIRSEKFNKLDQNITTYFDILKFHNYHFYGYHPTIIEMIGIFPQFENDDSVNDRSPSLTRGLGKKIIDKLKIGMKEPWMLYIHAMDLHSPIVIPKEFDNVEFGNTKYEKQISAIDSWLGKIFKVIDLRSTLVVVTADHGSYVSDIVISDQIINFEDDRRDGFYTKIGNKVPKFLKPLKDQIFYYLVETRKEKKERAIKNLNLKPYQKRNILSEKFNLDHTLYDEIIRVPLLISGYNIKEKKLITNQVRSVDIFPTICSLLDIPSRENFVDGKNLTPLINGQELNELPAYIESNPLIQLKSNDVIGIRTSKYKYFRDVQDPQKRVHLFNLSNDPFEDINTAYNEPSIVQEMEKILQDILSSRKFDKVHQTIREDTTKRIEEEYKKLGYI